MQVIETYHSPHTLENWEWLNKFIFSIFPFLHTNDDENNDIMIIYEHMQVK